MTMYLRMHHATPPMFLDLSEEHVEFDWAMQLPGRL